MNFNWAHIHLLSNHIPILGVLFGTILLIAGMIIGGENLKRAALWTFVVSSFLTILVYFSGTYGMEMVEALPNVSQEVVHTHMEFAEKTSIVIWILGAVSLVIMLLRRTAALKTSWLIAPLLLGIVGSGMAAWTGELGGQVRHTEIRGNYSNEKQAHDEHGESGESKESCESEQHSHKDH